MSGVSGDRNHRIQSGDLARVAHTPSAGQVEFVSRAACSTRRRLPRDRHGHGTDRLVRRDCTLREPIDPGIQLTCRLASLETSDCSSTRSRSARRTVATTIWRFPATRTTWFIGRSAGLSKPLTSSGGFNCRLGKSIPAGAGMGGASSDAASALRCCSRTLRDSAQRQRA